MASSASTTLSSPFLRLELPSRTKKRSSSIIPVPSIRASVSEKPPLPAVSVTSPEPSKLPIRKIPGDCGFPVIGPLKDRQDYFYKQGRDEFFKSRIQKYQSTVFRTNMPPGPFLAPNPNVVVLLDAKTFPILFDNSKVDKRDVFTGTFMPSTQLTGGYRVLSLGYYTLHHFNFIQ